MGSKTWIYFGGKPPAAAPGEQHYKPPLQISMEKWPCRAAQPHRMLKSSSSKGRRCRRRVRSHGEVEEGSSAGSSEAGQPCEEAGRLPEGSAGRLPEGSTGSPRLLQEQSSCWLSHSHTAASQPACCSQGWAATALNNRRQIISAIYYVEIKKKTNRFSNWACLHLSPTSW